MHGQCLGKLVASRSMGSVLSRAALLRSGVAGGAALAGLGTLTGRAGAATPDNDLAYLRLLLAAELLLVDFQTRAAASGRLDAGAKRLLEQMLADESAHATGLGRLLTAAGQTPLTADDVDFRYPKGAFATRASILQQAAELESLTLGAYLGAVERVETPGIRLPLGQIAANEAQHLSTASRLAGGREIGRPFAASLTIAAASDALDAYES
jgi:hypothetical protein